MGRNRQGVGQLLFVQRKQHVDRGLVALLDRRRRVAAHHALVAEVFENQQAVIEIGVMDDRAPRSRIRRRPFAIATKGTTLSARCATAL